jgi:hypothetical protein
MPYYLFIDPLPPSFTSDDVAALLRAFEEITSANMAGDSLGYSLRFGRAEMQTEDEEHHGNVFGRATLTVFQTEECELAPYPLPARKLAS